MYNTKQKDIILNYLKDNKDKCLTINDIYNSLREKNNIGYTTIYRYLNNLVNNNIVQKYISDNNECSMYKYINTTCNKHYHLKCIKCGKLIHLDCEEISILEKHFFDKHKFKIDKNKTTIYGICGDCNEK